MSPRNEHSHKASLAACIAAMYLALVVDSATISCVLTDHKTGGIL